MSFFEKNPLDCSTLELNNFLKSRNYTGVKNLRKSDKITIVKDLLKSEGRTTVRIMKPDNLLARAKYYSQKSRYSKTDSVTGSESESATRSSVSIIPRKHPFDPDYQATSTRVESTRQNLPAYDPSPIESVTSTDNGIKPREPIVKTRPERPPLFQVEKMADLSISDDSEIDFPRGGPTGIEKPETKLKTEHTEQGVSYENPMLSLDASRPVPPPRTSRNSRNINYSQTFSQPVIKGFKFTDKYGDNMDIEDYILSLNRWRTATGASDSQAIMQGLANFSNVTTANQVVETLPDEAMHDFVIFVNSLREKLGKTARAWYQQFNRDVRKSNESCYLLLGKLASHLRLGLEVSVLSAEHEKMVVERFLECLHPELRGILEARDDPPRFDNIAEIANRVELARGIPRIKPASINNTLRNPTKTDQREKDSKAGACFTCHQKGHFTHECPFRQKSNSILPQKSLEKCTCCKKVGHNAERCFLNPLSENFDLKKYREFHVQKHVTFSGN